MEIKEIQDAIQEILANRDDPERAHSLEDKLYFNFIKSLADNPALDCDYISRCAEEVLQTKTIKFARWCA